MGMTDPSPLVRTVMAAMGMAVEEARADAERMARYWLLECRHPDITVEVSMDETGMPIYR
jgi:hypothetical protein